LLQFLRMGSGSRLGSGSGQILALFVAFRHSPLA